MYARALIPFPVAGVALGLVICDPALAQVPIVNGDFNSDISGWELPADPEIVVSWDGSQGSPAPGSMRFSTSFDPPQGLATFEAFGPCFSAVPGEKLTIEGMVLADPRPPGVTCIMYPVLFDGLNCTGNRTFVGNVPLNTPGVWESKGLTFTVFPAAVSARASLEMTIFSGTGIVSCNFDSLTLTSDSRSLTPSEIPTLPPSGLLILGILLVISAKVLIGRRAQSSTRRLAGSAGHDVGPRP